MSTEAVKCNGKTRDSMSRGAMPLLWVILLTTMGAVYLAPYIGEPAGVIIEGLNISPFVFVIQTILMGALTHVLGLPNKREFIAATLVALVAGAGVVNVIVFGTQGGLMLAMALTGSVLSVIFVQRHVKAKILRGASKC